MTTDAPVRHETGIQWTHVPGYIGATWNPTTGCARVSPGCDHCYAFELHDQRYMVNRSAARAVLGPAEHADGQPNESNAQLARRLGHKLPMAPQYDVPFSRVQLLDERRLTEPLRARKPRAYFVDSMADLFHEAVPAEFIDRVFSVMARSPQHLFLILTKRPGRMRQYIGDIYRGTPATRVLALAEHEGPGIGELRWPLPNVWLGVSVEDQERADERIPLLIDTPAAVRFLSCEPLLGPVELPTDWCREHFPFSCECTVPKIDWVIVGGESGRHARPFDLAWARGIRDWCAEYHVPLFVKQLGRWVAGDHADLPFGPRSWLLEDGGRFVPPVLGPNVRTRPEGAVAFGLGDPHGGRPHEWPADLRVREWPEVAR